MFKVQFPQRFHLFWRLLHNTQACKTGTFSNGNTNMACNPERYYQVVVAATQEMGIGKDGKLPWHLPSDLRFFKELTTFTSIDGKRNAVIMGRRTWDSIPHKYRPLPGRLNVVLTRAGKLEAASSSDDLLMCNDLCLALRLLAEPPLCMSIEKVFVVGGGQILKDALNGPKCEAIHLTDIKSSIKCDTFIPGIDLSLFSPLILSSQMEENDIHFSFVTYVRTSNSAEEPSTSLLDGCNTDREAVGIEALSLKTRHAEFNYLEQIHENIACRKRGS
ncbi:Bifunctional dihydrofolate reductase-thymidylate synthase [Bienertia sinuspersici]